MIMNMERKPLATDAFYREGKVYCKLWDTEIAVELFDEEVTLEYAERCAAAMNAMPEALIDAICRAAKAFCLDFCENISEESQAELKLSVPVNADTPPRELLKCFQPTGLVVDPPEDPAKIGYQLGCVCDWEEEHGMEIDILDDKLVFLSEFTGESPWGDHTDDLGNYANKL